MSDTEALLGKADALLLRLRSSAQDEFPVLTEIVDLPISTGDHVESATRPQQSTPIDDVDVDELCRQLQAQLTQSLDLGIRRWVDEVLLAQLEQELRLALQLSLKRAVDESRSEILLRIGEALSEVIDSELRTRFCRRD